MNKIKGFTLLEMLVVCAIIMILGTIVATGFSNYKERAMLDNTKALIERLKSSLQRYYEKFQEYPKTTGTWEGSQNLYYFLGEKIEVVVYKNQETGEEQIEPYGPIEYYKKQELDSEKYILDSWGNRLYYKCPGDDHLPNGLNNKTSFDIASWGPNGEEDKDPESEKYDDITNWDMKD
ncbi:MAG: prepilin-type N-terminal cleavage/methylation domain-containing protein [Planctomycetes bacterium]|nr:prepilin-type N-terminal cleavage/methylation domain-containing protein [Planctomycetota bacterium]